MKLRNKTIDWLLIPTFLAVAATGIGLHLAGHRGIHEIWHNWAVAHIIASVLMLITVICHVYLHWGWYKSLFTKGFGKKSRLTALLTVIFVAIVTTGIILLAFVDGEGSHMGLWHYWIGLALTAIAAIHIALRIKVLIKMTKK